jgi:hypothetical protein
VPRELLWAIIFSLAVFVVALWPSQYPYSQAPKVNSEQQAKDAIAGGSPSERGPAAQINPSGEQQREHGGDHASEITLLGVKPGEWLLSIVTLMLWGVTVRLVRGSEDTAKRQLRAYIHVSRTEVRDFLNVASFMLQYENRGQTPAHNLKVASYVTLEPTPVSEECFRRNLEYGSHGTLGPGGMPQFFLKRGPRQLTESETQQLRAGTLAILFFGQIKYEDAFEAPRTTEFRYFISGENWLHEDGRMSLWPSGNQAD